MKLIGKKSKRIKTLMTYNIFRQKAILLLDHQFLEKERKFTKKKDLKSPWITTRIKFEDAIMSDGHISDGQMYSFFQH